MPKLNCYTVGGSCGSSAPRRSAKTIKHEITAAFSVAGGDDAGRRARRDAADRTAHDARLALRGVAAVQGAGGGAGGGGGSRVFLRDQQSYDREISEDDRRARRGLGRRRGRRDHPPQRRFCARRADLWRALELPGRADVEFVGVLRHRFAEARGFAQFRTHGRFVYLAGPFDRAHGGPREWTGGGAVDCVLCALWKSRSGAESGRRVDADHRAGRRVAPDGGMGATRGTDRTLWRTRLQCIGWCVWAGWISLPHGPRQHGALRDGISPGGIGDEVDCDHSVSLRGAGVLLGPA